MTLLEAHGYAAARQEVLQADASKHYTRLSGGPRPALLMRTPSAEYLDAFLRVGAHLAGLGLSGALSGGHLVAAALLAPVFVAGNAVGGWAFRTWPGAAAAYRPAALALMAGAALAGLPVWN